MNYCGSKSRCLSRISAKWRYIKFSVYRRWIGVLKSHPSNKSWSRFYRNEGCVFCLLHVSMCVCTHMRTRHWMCIFYSLIWPNLTFLSIQQTRSFCASIFPTFPAFHFFFSAFFPFCHFAFWASRWLLSCWRFYFISTIKIQMKGNWKITATRLW